MDGSLPTSLKYIISNVEYYGPALYLLGKNTLLTVVEMPFILSFLFPFFDLSMTFLNNLFCTLFVTGTLYEMPLSLRNSSYRCGYGICLP